MPLSHEIKAANQVVVGILHTDITTLRWAFGIRNLIIPGREDLREWNPFLPISGAPFDHARSGVAMEMLRRGAEYLFFLDSDVICPKDTILRLMAHKKPIISGVYARRSPPHMLPVMMRGGTWVPPEQIINAGIIEVDVVGAGCLLIHRTVFETLPPQRPQAGKTWFDWRVDCQGVPGTEPHTSEDFSFCLWAKAKLGISTLVDTSIVCQHVGYAQSTPGQFVPMDGNNPST